MFFVAGCNHVNVRPNLTHFSSQIQVAIRRTARFGASVLVSSSLPDVCGGGDHWKVSGLIINSSMC